MIIRVISEKVSIEETWREGMARMQWMLGKVQWFDDLSGQGVISGENGEDYFVHYSSIDSSKKRKSLKQNKKVKFQVINDPHLVQVSKVKEL